MKKIFCTFEKLCIFATRKVHNRLTLKDLNEKNFYTFVMKMIFQRYRDVSEGESEEVNEQQKLNNNNKK